MENKKIIIIAALAITICILAGAIFGILNKTVDYERVELIPNGTSMEIPKNNASYVGEVNGSGVKQWTFKQGTVMTFNSEEALNARGLYGLGGALGIKEIKDLIINHFEKKETIDGFSVYTLDGETMDIQGRDKVYCIMTENDTTHDNIIIATDNKDVSLHIAKSIQYKLSDSSGGSVVTSGTHSNGDKTYPGPDGKGSYHVGDTVDNHDKILQLQSDGSWVQISVATGSEQHDNNKDDSDANNINGHNDVYSSSISSSSSSVETTTDGGNIVNSSLE